MSQAVQPAAPAPVVEQRARGAVRPWSALVCGVEEDRTLLIVDWLLLACRSAGLVAQAVPVAAGDAMPAGMYVEVAASIEVEPFLGEVPWGAVDLVIAGEHLELMRAIEAGFVDPSVTTVVASCRRSYTQVERVVAPQYVLAEREIDAAASAAARSYHAFDGPQVAGWYRLPAGAQAGLLLGAIEGSSATGLDAEHFRAAIEELGIDPGTFLEAFERGRRLGRREGGRIRRPRTAYQFTRRRRKLVAHHDRAAFEELVARAQQLVDPLHLPALQDAIFLACQFQDAEWARRLVQQLEEIIDAERSLLGDGVDPAGSVVPDAIRSLVALMVWPDAAWIANRKLRADRFKELRAAFGISRRDRYELIDHVPLDAGMLAASRSPRLPGSGADVTGPALLQPLRVERIRTTSLVGARRLRQLARSAARRSGSLHQQHELDSLDAWTRALHDTLRSSHELARLVARSGSLVQGSGAVREANRATAHAFWGRVVRPSLAIDRSHPRRAGDAPVESVAELVIPFAWEQLCRSGPLAFWEYAAQVLGIALAHSRGVEHGEAVRMARVLCEPRRPLEGS